MKNISIPFVFSALAALMCHTLFGGQFALAAQCKVALTNNENYFLGNQYTYDHQSRIIKLERGRFSDGSFPQDLDRILRSKGYEPISSKKAADILLSGFIQTKPNQYYYPDFGSLAEVTLRDRKTGFTKSYRGNGKPAVEDPRKTEILRKLSELKQKMSAANNASEYAGIKAEAERVEAELQSGNFQDTPEVIGYESIAIPTCAEFQGTGR